ncbi:MAG TPA: hypothetical protein VHF45_01850 [Thermoleophilaceae bacterium]|nr:hypothetical protein [Thermoleophilaceae bacterium]
MRRGLALIAAIALLGAAGCGGDDDEGGNGGAKDSGAPTAKSGSSIECLSLSTLSPELYKSKGDADKSIQPLLTPGAKGAAILTGQFGADVIEYPDAAAATEAQQKARESKAIAKQAGPDQIHVFDRTLFIDYTEEAHVRRVVEACATKPDQPPPT